MLKRILVLAVTATVVPAFMAGSPALADDGFKDGQKKEIRKIVRDYLIKNPEVIVEALREMRRREEAAKVAAAKKAIGASRDALLKNTSDPVGGNKKGDVTVVEFFDYNCGWCKRTYTHMKAAVKSDGNVRIVYKEFPILAPSSRMAAQVALAARKQGKYEKVHTMLMTHRGALDESKIMAIAEQAGLNMPQLKTDMKSPEVEAAIAANMALARKLNIGGTPAFIIGGKLIPGFMRAGQFISEINRTRKECTEKKMTVC